MEFREDLNIKETLEDLQKFLRKQHTLKGEKRIRSLILLKSNRFKTRQKVADYLGIHIRTLERWINNYKKGGIKKMLTDKPKIKKKKLITSNIHQGLEKKLQDISNPLSGYSDAQKWVESEFKVDVKYHNLRKYLIHNFQTKIKSESIILDGKEIKTPILKSQKLNSKSQRNT